MWMTCAKVHDHQVTVVEGGGRAEAIKLALSMAEPNWTVVVLGRGDLEFQEVENRLVPFRDAEVVRSAWAELKGSL